RLTVMIEPLTPGRYSSASLSTSNAYVFTVEPSGASDVSRSALWKNTCEPSGEANAYEGGLPAVALRFDPHFPPQSKASQAAPRAPLHPYAREVATATRAACGGCHPA